MKTFVFMEKNGNASITLSSENFESAKKELGEKVKYLNNWRVEDKDGEDEGENFFQEGEDNNYKVDYEE
jgi:hypothetical protein